jgi:hypothetical protein
MSVAYTGVLPGLMMSRITMATAAQKLAPSGKIPAGRVLGVVIDHLFLFGQKFGVATL